LTFWPNVTLTNRLLTTCYSTMSLNQLETN
jgi:hypothetical protein